MLPTFRQRWIIFIAIVIGGFVWCMAGGPLESPSALTGISIFQSQVSPATAIVLIIAAGIPAFVLGLFAASAANVLAGVFVIAIALSALAGSGGGAQGFLFRSPLPGEYGWLIVEMMIWLIGLIIVLMLMEILAPIIKPKLPSLLTLEHHRGHLGIFSETLRTQIGAAIWSGAIFGLSNPKLKQPTSNNPIKFRLPHTQEIFSLVLTCVIGGFLTNLFMQSPGAGQAIGSLIIAFAIAGCVTEMALPESNLPLVLISPAIVGAASYAYMLVRYASPTQILSAYYQHTIPGVALVLPIFYISAGVAGATLGVALARAIEYAKNQANEEAQNQPIS